MEKTDRLDAQPVAAARLQALLSAWTQRVEGKRSATPAGSTAPEFPDLTSEQLQQLEALGYH